MFGAGEVMRKGFVVTISTLLLLIVILLFLQANYRRVREAEGGVIDAQQIDYASYAFDDVATDLKQLFGPVVLVEREGGSSTVKFSDTFPRNVNLLGYKEFLANYSERINSRISLNTSRIEEGKLIIFSNGLRYNRNSSSIKFYSPDESTNATLYELAVFLNDYRVSENLSLLTQNGDVEFVVHYYDLNGSLELSGAFDSSSKGVYSVVLENGGVQVNVGNVSNSMGGIEVSLSGSVVGEVNLTAKGSWQSLGYAYDAEMVYEQLNVRKEGLVWVEKG